MKSCSKVSYKITAAAWMCWTRLNRWKRRTSRAKRWNTPHSRRFARSPCGYLFTIVDCAPGLSESTLATICESEQVILVTTAELPAVRNIVRYIDHLTQLEYPTEQVQVVLNRDSKKTTITDDQIEKAIRRKISLRIPNSYADVSKAINAGIPVLLDRRSEFGAAFEQWATSLITKRPKVAVVSKESSTLLQGLGLRRLLTNEGGKGR